MNYPKMDAEKVAGLQAEGRRHLQFVIRLYRRQLELGLHFLSIWRCTSTATLTHESDGPNSLDNRGEISSRDLM